MMEDVTPRFEAVVFDLFNTLVHFDYSLMPEVEVEAEGEQRRVRSTAVEVHRQICRELECEISFAKFWAAFLGSQQALSAMKDRDNREYSSTRRFSLCCEMLGLDRPGLPERMVELHMGEMFRMMYCPDHKREVVAGLKDYRVFLASNFDHGPTARRALHSFGLSPHLEEAFISEEVGWRKPGARFFDAIVRRTGIDPERCLFVGDDPVADAWGATQAGFRVAWLAEGSVGQRPPVEPAYTLSDLLELRNLLAKAGSRAD